MRRFLLLVAGLLAATAGLRAQTDPALLYGSRQDLLAASLFPARWGMSPEDGTSLVLPFLPSLHAGAGTDWAAWSDLRLFSDGNLAEDRVDAWLDALPRSVGTRANLRFDAFALGVPIRVGEDRRELFSLSLRWTERAVADLGIGKGALELAWRGNAPFAGTPLELTPLDGHAQAWREWTLGAVVPVYRSDALALRVGAHGKYLTGYAAGSLATERFDLLTAADGSSIEATVDAELQSAGWFRDAPGGAGDALRGAGSGWGLDLGLSARWLDRWTLDAGVVDLGRIRYDGAGEAVRVRGDFFFEGVDLGGLAGDGIGNPLDSLLEGFSADTISLADASFRLPARWTLRLGYGVPAENARGRRYYRHQVYAHLVQRRAPGPGSAPRTEAGLAYLFNAGDVAEFGTSIGYGPAAWTWSALVGLRFGPFRWSLASGLPSTFLPGGAVRADLSTRMGLTF